MVDVLHSTASYTRPQITRQYSRAALLPPPPPPHHLLGYINTPSIVAVSLNSSIPAPPLSDAPKDVPPFLSGTEKVRRIQKPKSPKAESCTRKCVATCIRGGGEGPLNVIRPLVVFKEGFRSRQYCLVECSEICNLILED